MEYRGDPLLGNELKGSIAVQHFMQYYGSSQF